MIKYTLITILFGLSFTPLAAEKEKGYFEFNNDHFLAASTAVQVTKGVDDLFMFGDTVRSEQDIAGSAHLFGRRVISQGAIGRDAYLAGMVVSQEGRVTGDLTVSGYEVQVGGVDGDLRASGNHLIMSGKILGYALVAGDKIEFNAEVKGDVSLKAQEVEFSEGARIDGTLFIFEKQTGDIKIPTHLIPEARIERRHFSEWSDAANEVEFWDWRDALGEFLVGVLIIAGIAALIAALIPQKLADLRRNVLDNPIRTLLMGFLTMSAVIGSTLLLIISVVGLILTPVALAILFLGAYAGYVVGAYAIGVGLLLLAKQPEPDGFGARALAAGVGAVVAAAVTLIPYIGWILILAITFAGLGSIAIWLFRPMFFTSE
jgi:cytoskeletal protein CcmA (bactofilin family)